MSRRLTSRLLATSAALLFSVTGVPAEYPEKNITVIVPYSAGGGFDSYVRGVLPAMQKYLPI